MLIAGVLLSCTTAVQAAGDDVVDFNQQVRPILSEYCFACHGPDAHSLKGDVRLDLRESVVKPNKHGNIAIVPGEPQRSELVRRIHADDDSEIMPPPESHKTLSDKQKRILTQWIEQGAEYQPHWAYVPPKATEAPAVPDADWPVNFIDHYIAARLEKEGLTPSAEADRVTLIRRLSFDLTGLPPTPRQIEKFVSDDSPDAYENLVDRLLASPHFGERMAIWWLDLVRYADTVGYHGDQDHRIWPYRDYVIESFNANKPFDQFTREQLAGDLLDEPSQAQLVATGYNRLLQTSHEGGVQLKEYRAIYMADRVRNVSQVFMGATVGCAQCHDHKYDPYTARDFYTLGAFFADVDDEEHLRNPYGGLNSLPTNRFPEMPVIKGELRDKLAKIDEQLDQLNQKVATVAHQIADSPEAHIEKLRQRVANFKPTDQPWIDDQVHVGGRVDGNVKQVKASQGPVRSGESSRLQQSGQLTQVVYREIDQPVEIRPNDQLYAWVYIDAKRPPKALMLQFKTDEWKHRAYWGASVIPYGKNPKGGPTYHRSGDLPEAGQWVRLEVSPEAVGLKNGDKITSFAWTQHGGAIHWDDAGVTRNSVLPEAVYTALQTPENQRTAKQQDTLIGYLTDQAVALDEINEQKAKLKQQRDKITKQAPRTMYTKALDKPRTVRVLPRGNWLDESGPIVEPAIPEFMGELDTGDRRATRLDLAGWLVKPAKQGGVGEMTARVQANRLWELFFNVGISRTLGDFGGQGEPPVHPELLDRLALHLIEADWDIKHMVKTLVMSRTYRQSSVATPKLKKLDPDNRLYARQSRPRLPAEMVRDNALAISGLLIDDKIGGPSVKPYQPDGYYSHLNFPKRKYKSHGDERQWRRGLYIHWQRQFLHPMLKAFDAPSREECTADRPESNIPTQALTLLNDPTFVEAARHFAARIMTEPGANADATDRIRWAFRVATSRTPDADEVAVLKSLLTQHRAQFAAEPSDADRLMSVGQSPAAKDIDPVELAAWTSVARALLNLNETITRN